MALGVPGFLDSRRTRRIGVVVLGAAATAGVYRWLLFHSGLPTTLQKHVAGARAVGSYLRGPYVGWHVLVVALVLGLGAVWAGWLGFPLLGAFVETVALVTCWSITAATDRTSNTAWPIGAVLIGWVCFGGALLVGSLVAQVRSIVSERQARREYEAAQARAFEAAEESARLASENAARFAADQAALQAAMARAADAQRRFESERAARLAARISRVKVAKVSKMLSPTGTTGPTEPARSSRKAPSP